VQGIQLNHEQTEKVTSKSEVERMLRTKILEERQAIFEEGKVEGEVSGFEKVAERGIKNGFSDDIIQKFTGLDLDKIKEIRKRLELS
jgi:hypothetical protein